MRQVLPNRPQFVMFVTFAQNLGIYCCCWKGSLFFPHLSLRYLSIIFIKFIGLTKSQSGYMVPTKAIMTWSKHVRVSRTCKGQVTMASSAVRLVEATKGMKAVRNHTDGEREKHVLALGWSLLRAKSSSRQGKRLSPSWC